jgi:hypothetical protein
LLTVAQNDDNDDGVEEAIAPPFSGRYRNFDLHTHAPIGHLLYHLGPTAFVGENHGNLTLTNANAALWTTLTQKIVAETLKKMRLKIPGGKMGTS